jgi:hypothetical protein
MPPKSIFNKNSTLKTFSETPDSQQTTVMRTQSQSLTEIYYSTRVIPPEWRCRVRELGQLKAPIKSFPGLAAAWPRVAHPKQLK